MKTSVAIEIDSECYTLCSMNDINFMDITVTNEEQGIN